ncbi:Radical SAM superfamily enzyme, MoaA/NifB/PqqE/SkfB family [Clostridium cavendishii DSM 21758]|uniref:Radical SAM superfamily enzyme, MoaA/NifB/PqqE/SkfB family n=1 Tax=Clostridium cavendishii DSM 21758 TaxID=1121302 RepID=A0A1M6CCH3_9CLOT|nr:radical SAM protein [Clostridium cavendishii]SHI58563.1 Radical SAM superfamily enzyme, MoaA/NifB/PqqE/SkfB family [Clostridium cavendishii DSM 21758]
MQPNTNVKFDENSFNILKKTLKNISNTKHNRDSNSSFATNLPVEIGIQLTNRCNLRCKHCFEWNKDGYLQNVDEYTKSGELDKSVLKQIFLQTREAKSNMYLWGGEPLCYSYWDEVISILEEDKRWTIICTNGILVDKKLDSLLKISENVVLLISVDGFEEENDAIRGKGTFKKVIENIKLLMDLKKKGIFKGEVSVNCVISEAMTGKLYDFMEFFEKLGINTVYFGYPWYLPEDTANNMDIYFKENFDWLKTFNDDYIPSWHSYKYNLNKDILKVLIPEIQRLNSRVWNIRIRFQPALEIPQIENFIAGKEIPAQHRKCCLSISNRMNVLPSGKVTVCKNFPEFTVGDLNNETVEELWHNNNFKKCREILSSNLTPVCSKCILLYLHGV